MKRPGENSDARQDYLRMARDAGLDERAAEAYADDVLRMDVIEHVEGWMDDEDLYAEWRQLRRRTMLIEPRPADRPVRRQVVLRIERNARPVFVPASATTEHIRVLLPDGTTALATAEQVYRLVLSEQPQEEHAQAV